MDKMQAIHQFWSQFGWPVYDETDVPDEAEYPYITYSVQTSSYDYVCNLTASLWLRSTQWIAISQKADQIEKTIGAGQVIKIDGGYAWFYKGNPFAQRLADEDDGIRRIYINISVEFLTE